MMEKKQQHKKKRGKVQHIRGCRVVKRLLHLNLKLKQ